MNNNMFEFDSYKAFLKAYIREHQRSGITAELAKAAGCNRSYFSQTLNGKAHLTPDHAVNLAEALKFSEGEKNFFLLLVLHDRAADAGARQHFKTRIARQAQENLVLTKKIAETDKAAELSDRLKARYYSDWRFGAVHILVSMKEYQSVEAVAAKLRIDNASAGEVLSALIEMKLVEKRGSRFLHVGGNLHIGFNSPYNVINHLQWRNKAVERSSTSQEGVHYTTAFSIAKKDWVRLKRQLIDFIEAQRSTIHASESEELYCFCCDLFAPI